MKYSAEIIAVGTEILLGNIANTDAQDLSEALSQMGIDVYHHTVVGDNPDRLKDAVAIAKERANIIITTGGLGPTYDDLTKQTLAQTFGRKLVYNEQQAQKIKSYFNKKLHGVKMTENNLQQAWLPEGCTVFENSCGTAPGCGFEQDGIHVLMLPGPPRECRTMIKTGVIPYLSALSREGIYSHNIYIIGSGESAVEDKLHDMMTHMTNPTLAPYAKDGYCLLRLTAKAATQQQAQQMMQPVLEKVLDILGDVVYGVDTGTIQQTVVPLLKNAGLTLAAAESYTGGLIAKRITDVPGASSVFRGGVVAYTDDVKADLLGVDRELLARKGAVCREVALAMAENVAKKMGADIGIGTTGVAGPDSDDRGNPVGLVYIALYFKGKTYCMQFNMNTHREQIRNTSTLTALDMVRRAVMSLPVER